MKKNLSCVFAAISFAILCASPSQAEDTIIEVFEPGSEAFAKLNIKDYEARYTSSFSKTGEFTLHVRTSGDGKKLSMVDIIPGETSVIVAQRVIDLESQRLEFSAGPYFAWGPEFIVSQSNGDRYDWARVSIGGGEPKRSFGEIAHSGYVSEMFSPLLASLMPRDVGASFQLPNSYARKGETVSSELDTYEVVGREELETPSGLKCNCWVLDKTGWAGGQERIWVSLDAPYVFKRHRDVGGPRSFVSELLSFRRLDR